MNYLQENTRQKSAAWYRHWFDSTHYHKLYANRDEKEAQQFIDQLVAHLKPERGASVIDVGCGTGRHCKHLASKGFEVTGIDLSFSNIKEAKKIERKSLQFFRHDMRLPFGNNNFSYVFNFYTSFGYFNESSEHDIVIKNMSRALKPGGVLVLDFLNAPYAEKHLIAEETREIDGIRYLINRWSDEEYINKKISMDDIHMQEQFHHIEKVIKFRLRDFQRMFAANCLLMKNVFGDYGLNKYDPDNSPRMIMIAEKL